MMGPACCVALLAMLAAIAPSANGAAIPLSSLQRNAYQVSITGFVQNGVTTPPAATPCTNPNMHSPCAPVVQADQDAVEISYGPAPGMPLPAGANVSIYACYSNVSSFNRPWRANMTAKSVLLDKACHFKILKNKTAATPGTVMFKPDDLSPTSTVFIRAYVTSAPNKPYGYANAPQGFFMIKKIDTPGHKVRSAAIGMCFVGPIVLAVGLTLDSYLTKRRKSR